MTAKKDVTGTMEFGAHLPHLGRQVGRESLIDFAQAIERAGFASGWVSDHVCWPAGSRRSTRIRRMVRSRRRPTWGGWTRSARSCSSPP